MPTGRKWTRDELLVALNPSLSFGQWLVIAALQMMTDWFSVQAMLSRCFIGAALAVALPVLAQDYEIRLHHPDRVGQKTQVSISGQDSQEMAAWSGGTKMRGEKKEFTPAK